MEGRKTDPFAQGVEAVGLEELGDAGQAEIALAKLVWFVYTVHLYVHSYTY